MSENNQMIQKPKMGFLQRVKKAMLIRNINEVKYAKAPETLKMDMEVVSALLAASPSAASTISDNLKLQAVSQDKTLFEKLPSREQLSLAEIEPKLISKMPEDLALTYIQKHGMVYVKHLSEELQERLLTEKITVEKTIVSFDPEWTQRAMDSFSPDVVERVITNAAEKAKGENAAEEDKRAYETLYNNAPIVWMSEEMQRKLVAIDSRFIDKTSDEVFISLIQENPSLIRNARYHLSHIASLDIQTQLALAKTDSRVTSALSQEALEQYVRENPEGLQALDENTKIELAAKYPEYVEKLNLNDEQKAKLAEDKTLVKESSDTPSIGDESGEVLI